MFGLRHSLILPFATAALLVASTARAQVPAKLPVQGFLQDADGAPVQGPTSITVSIYEAPVGGAAAFTETQVVEVVDGRFVLFAGDTVPLAWTLLDGTDGVYVGLAIADDAELSPRFELATIPFAARAEDALTLQGATAADFSTIGHRHDWSELDGVPAELADGDADTLGGLTCPSGQIPVASGVGNWACGADAVGLTSVQTADLANGAVTAPKIAAGAVGSSEIAAGAVGAQQIAAGAVRSSALASRAVARGQIAINAVTSSELAPGAVQTTDLAANAVTADKLGFGTSNHCVAINQTQVIVGDRRFCGLSDTPNGLSCRIVTSGTGFRLIQSPPGTQRCCMRCF